MVRCSVFDVRCYGSTNSSGSRALSHRRGTVPAPFSSFLAPGHGARASPGPGRGPVPTFVVYATKVCSRLTAGAGRCAPRTSRRPRGANGLRVNPRLRLRAVSSMVTRQMSYGYCGTNQRVAQQAAIPAISALSVGWFEAPGGPTGVGQGLRRARFRRSRLLGGVGCR
jgi:hypothetical protein